MELPVKRRRRLGIELEPGKHTNVCLTIPYWMASCRRNVSQVHAPWRHEYAACNHLVLYLPRHPNGREIGANRHFEEIGESRRPCGETTRGSALKGPHTASFDTPANGCSRVIQQSVPLGPLDS